MGWKEDAKTRAQELKSGKTFKLEQGETTFRILPNKKDPKARPYVEVKMHGNVGPDEMSVRCGYNSKGEGSCWLCDKKIPQLEQSNSESKRKLAQRMAAYPLMILQVSSLDSRQKFTAPKPMWARMGGARSLGTILLGLIASPKLNCEDPDRGKNITIDRSGERLKTNYGTPIPDDEPSKVPEAILKLCKTLGELTPKYDAAEQERMYKGEARPDDDSDRDRNRSRARDDDEDDKPRGGKKRPADDDDDEAAADPDEEDPDAEDPDAEDPDAEDPDADPDEEAVDPDEEDPDADPDEADADAEEGDADADDDPDAEDPDAEADADVDDPDADPEFDEDPGPPKKPAKKKAAPPPAKKKAAPVPAKKPVKKGKK
jgi:hypothetical protein